MSMSTTARRTAALASTALATAALAGALVITPAGADQPDAGATGEAPGNRGTVKIHEVGTPEDDHRNEPQVCDFEIVGFGFPDDANLGITIEGHGGPNSGTGSFSSTVTAEQLSEEGDWVVDGPTLPDGMYKLYVENTTAPGGAKQKVFKVDCPEGDDVVVDDDDVIVDNDVVVDDDDDVIDDDVVVDGSTDTVGGTQVLGAVLTRDLTAAAPAAAVTTPAPQVAGSALARTGAEVVPLTVVASALMIVGGALVRIGRRRSLA